MHNEEAKDLTQEFLLEMIEGDLLGRYSADRGTFRAYLRGALHLFLLERHRKEGSLKRGGHLTVLPLTEEETRSVDGLVASEGRTPEEAFDRQWMNSVIDLALNALKEEMAAAGKELQFNVFDRYSLHRPTGDPPTYAQLAAEFGIKETDVTNYIAACRRSLRARIIDQVRDYAASDLEVTEEIAKYFRL
jgi:DNA-directed RNA polymerase specialized sigma24 family protein